MSDLRSLQFRPKGRPGRGAWNRPATALLTVALILTGLAPAMARQLLDVRFGRHQDRIRAVIDLDAEAAFTQATSADGQTVTVRLGDTGLKTPGTRTLNNLEPLTQVTIAAGPAPADAEVRFQATRPLQVVSVETLPPAGSNHYRIAIDFAPAPATPVPPSVQGPLPTAAPVQVQAPAPVQARPLEVPAGAQSPAPAPAPPPSAAPPLCRP